MSKIEEDIVYDILIKIIPSTYNNITKGNNSDGSYYIRIESTNIDRMYDYYINFPIKLPLEIKGNLLLPENHGSRLPPIFFLPHPIIEEIHFKVIN